MDNSKWYFTPEQLANSPSRKCGMSADKELWLRQWTANLIQKMGLRLQISRDCMETAIVFMHRFYAFHSFLRIHRDNLAAAAVYLATRVEEERRSLQDIITVLHTSLGKNVPDPSQRAQLTRDITTNESILLQTLGFDQVVAHPYKHILKISHMIKAPKDLVGASKFLASNSVHLTTFCLQYKPSVVACFCVYLASKWSGWSIPLSSEGHHWFYYVDESITLDLLNNMTNTYLGIHDRCPTKYKRYMHRHTSSTQQQTAIEQKQETPHYKKRRSIFSPDRSPDIKLIRIC